MKDLPFMPLWVKDYLSDPFVVALGEMEEYCYFRLIMFSWIKAGELPDDPDQLAKLCKSPRHFKTRIWPRLASKFVLIKDGIRCHKRVSEELARITERHDKLSVAAKRGYLEKQARLKPGLSQAQASSESESDADDDVPSGTSRNPQISDEEAGVRHVEFFNSKVAPKLPGKPLVQLTKEGRLQPHRLASLRKRLEEYPDLWDRVLAEIPHLNQFAHDKKFIDFDYILGPKTCVKLLEGKWRVNRAENAPPDAYPDRPKRAGSEIQLGPDNGTGKAHSPASDNPW